MRRPHMRATTRSERTLFERDRVSALSQKLPHSFMHMHSISRNWKLGNGKNVAWESGARAQAAEAAAEGDVSGDV